MDLLKNLFKLSILTCCILLVSIFIALPVFAQESPSVDEHVKTPFVKRSSYTVASSEANSTAGQKKGKGGKTQSSSGLPFSNSTTGILSGVGTLLSVLIGAVFTWIKIKKRNSIFSSYLKQIEAQRAQVFAEIKSHSGSKEKLLKSLQEDLKKIQESAELSTADKKIEESQLTVITHKIQSAIKDIDPTATNDSKVS